MFSKAWRYVRGGFFAGGWESWGCGWKGLALGDGLGQIVMVEGLGGLEVGGGFFAWGLRAGWVALREVVMLFLLLLLAWLHVCGQSDTTELVL
jgi:hypothetical protein